MYAALSAGNPYPGGNAENPAVHAGYFGGGIIRTKHDMEYPKQRRRRLDSILLFCSDSARQAYFIANPLQKKLQVKPMVKRAEIYLANLNPVVGSEQGGLRPVLIIQNDRGNRYSPTVIIAAITAATQKAELPTHIHVMPEESGLHKPSIVLLEQIRTLDKSRLRALVGRLSEEKMRQIDKALRASLGFQDGA